MANQVGAPTGIEPLSPDNYLNINKIVLNSQEHCLTLIGVHPFTYLFNMTKSWGYDHYDTLCMYLLTAFHFTGNPYKLSIWINFSGTSYEIRIQVIFYWYFVWNMNTIFFTFLLFVLLSLTTPWRFLYLRETQANVFSGHMLSGGPNRELQANVILYWQGLQCWVEDLIGKNLCVNKILASNNLGGGGGAGVVTIWF